LKPLDVTMISSSLPMVAKIRLGIVKNG